MYGKAGRFPTPPSTTPCYISPDTYELEFQSCEPNKAYVPFLCGTTRKVSWVNLQQVKNPPPNVYNPEKYVKRRVVGGKAPQNTEPRFNKSPWTQASEDTGPGPASYGASNSPPFLKKKKKEKFPMPPCGNMNCPGGAECLCRRSKGVMRKAPLRGPCENVVPSIPNKFSRGYQQLYPCGPWCPIPMILPSLMPGPDYYDISSIKCHCTDKYKGNFWSLMRGTRKEQIVNAFPGPAFYEGIPTPEKDALYLLKQGYERFRDFKRSNACRYRFPQTVMNQAFRNKFPGPASYDIQDKDCCQIMGGVPFPPFLQGDARFHSFKNGRPGPADYQWRLHDSMEKARRMTNCLEPPFLTTQERFKRPKCWTNPGPGEYETNGIGDEDLCKQPLWDTLSPFGSSATRKTSYLIDDPCHPSPARYFKYPRSKKKRVSYAIFKSRTERFARRCKRDKPELGTYEATAAADALKARCDHLHPRAYCIAPFLNGEERFGNVGDWPNKKVENKNPAPNAYAIVVNSVGNAKGGIMGTVDKKCLCPCTPGPGHYKIHPQYSESHVYNTFNAKLSNPLPRVVPQLPKEPYAHRVAARKKLRCFVERVCPLVC